MLRNTGKLRESKHEYDDRAERVVSIMQRLSFRGIKLSSESQPELPLQHVVKQKLVGRRAWRQRAAFFFFGACYSYVTLQTMLNRGVCKGTTWGGSVCLCNPHLPDHSFCIRHQELQCVLSSPGL